MDLLGHLGENWDILKQVTITSLNKIPISLFALPFIKLNKTDAIQI
jgi:hypothetical protein